MSFAHASGRWARWGLAAGAALWAQLGAAGGPDTPMVAVPGDEPSPPQATNPPAGALPQTLALQAMQGPFPSLASYCSRVASELPSRRCIKSPNTWDTGERRAARGPFRSAQLLRTADKLGPHEVEVCRVALQSADGWFVSADNTPCTGQTHGATVTTTLDRFRWADEIGQGVLLVRAAHEDEVTVEQQRWWGALEVSFMDSRTSTMLCGMGLDGTPKCSEPLVDGCTAVEGGPETMRFADGRLEVADTGAAASQCTGRVPTAGSYVLPLRGAEPGRRGWVPAEDDGDIVGDADRVAATPLYGPFASIQQYCADLPDFGVWPDEVETDSEGSPKPRRRAEACAAAPGGWSGSLGARGAIGGVRLVRVRNDLVGTTIHHCRIAMKMASGWFLTTDYQTCQGLRGPDTSVDTRALPLRWMGAPDRPTALVGAVASETYDSYEEAPQGLGLGEPDPPRYARRSRSTYQGPRKRRVRVCGVGPSGVPSCTRWFDAGCQQANGRTTHDIAWNGATLEARQNGPIPEEEASECELERTSWTVTFP